MVKFGETVAEAEPLHIHEVSEPQVPENTWKRIFARAPPTVITGLTVCATKLYHTSGLLLLQAPIKTFVELVKVPFIVVQVWEGVNETAPVQSSLPGAFTTQILNAPLDEGVVPFVEYTLT